MSVINRIAYMQNRRDEVPNQELARFLVSTQDREGIREISEHLWDKNINIQSDCIKVLYEIGYIEPMLIADYVDDFLRLLKSKSNRLIWGSMLALSTIAEIAADKIYPHCSEIMKVMEIGSVITKDNGVKTLAIIAAKNLEYNKAILPFLLNHLSTCRPKDVPQHAEKILLAVNASNKLEFIQVLEKRKSDMEGAQLSRVNRVIKQAVER